MDNILGVFGARLSSFEPENPSWLIAKPYGLGWNLNLGKVAVATGLIRPDDSLPDLEEHIPARVSTALTWAPLAGAAVAAVAGHFVGMRDTLLPTHWGIDLRPDRLIKARPAAAVPVLLSVGLATWTLIDARQNRKVDTSLSAQTLGIEVFCLAALAELARYTEGDESPAWGIGLGVLAIPATALGVLVGTVNAALGNIPAEA